MQAKSFEVEVQHLWDVLEMVYEDSKFMKGVVDFNDLAEQSDGARSSGGSRPRPAIPLYEDIEKSWDEITFVKPADTEVERMNRTYIYEKDKLKRTHHPDAGQAAEAVRLPLSDPAPGHGGAARTSWRSSS